MSVSGKEWFEEWFESPYYDLLYAKRNEEEAAEFIDALLNYTNIPLQKKILDLACGKGRHSVYLNKLGFDVTGTDLSERSIRFAKSFENEKLEFLVGDMRVPLKQKFDVILNLFTSFGYFDTEEENRSVLAAVKSMLSPDGMFIIDYLNGEKIPSKLHYHTVQNLSGLGFDIQKKVHDGFIIKDIQITGNGVEKKFSEKVRLYTHADFVKMFEKTGLKIIRVFGDYKLNDFNHLNSDRIIYFTTLYN